MKIYQGKTILPGVAKGPALFTDQPVNFTAAFTKALNLLPWKRSCFYDRHHPWFGVDLKGKVVFLPTCIGSTHTGLVVLDLVRLGYGPAAIVVEEPDPLLIAGIVASDVWYGRSIPMLSCPISQFARIIAPNTTAEVNGDTGEIILHD